MNNFVAKIDCHLHTNFSGDCHETPENVVCECIRRGLEHICITDHLDLLLPDDEYKPFNMKSYLSCMRELQEKYRDKIQINVGIEVGYTKKCGLLNSKILQKFDYDYIINSVHIINDKDCYYPSFFENITREEALAQYLDCINKSLDAGYKMNCVGHLGYLSRYMPYAVKQIMAGEFDEILTTIFKKIIARDMILEINTASYGSGSDTLPNAYMLKKYRDCGGKQICFSSDAHTLSRIAENYPLAASLARSLDYENWTIIVDNKKCLIPI